MLIQEVGYTEVLNQILGAKVSFEEKFFVVNINGDETEVPKGSFLVAFANEKIKVPIEDIKFNERGECIIENSPVLLEGKWNRMKYTGPVLKKMVEEYNSRPRKRMRCSIYLDHMDSYGMGVMTWVGYLTDIYYDSKRKGAFGTLTFSDKDIVDKLRSQIDAGGGFWGLSPTIFIEVDEEEHDLIANCVLESLSVVTKPAQGDKAMMGKDSENNKDGGIEMAKKKAKVKFGGNPTDQDFAAQINATKTRIAEIKATLEKEEDNDEKEKIQNEIDFLEGILSNLEKANDIPAAQPPADPQPPAENEDTAILFPPVSGEYAKQDGNRYEKEIFHAGTFRDPNDASKLFHASVERMQKWVDNFKAKAKDKVDIPISHTEEKDKSLGDVIDLKLKGDRLFAILEFPDEPIRTLIDQGKIGDVSALIDLHHMDDRGTYWGEVLDHVCLTNTAQIPGLSGFRKIAMESIRHKYVAFEEVSPMKDGDKDESKEMKKLKEILDAALASNEALQNRTAVLEGRESERDTLAFESRIGAVVKDSKVPKGMEPRVTAFANSLRSSKAMFESDKGQVLSAEEFVSILESLQKHVAFEDDPRALISQDAPQDLRKVTKEEMQRFAKGEFAQLCKDGKIKTVPALGGMAVWTD